MIRFTKAGGSSVRAEDMSGVTLECIPIDSVHPNPFQPRRYFSDDAISELASSIKLVGLLQPISVRRLTQDAYELIAGERRLRASKLAGLTCIKALVLKDAPDRDSAMLAMIENLQRENLHYLEEAEGYQSLIREHGLTQEELARRMSKNQSTIANKLRILKLPISVKRKLVRHALTERHARALLRLHDETAQLRLIDRIVRDGLSVKETEELVERELNSLYGEEKDARQIRVRCGYRIYVNTIKRTVSKMTAMGARTECSTVEYDDRIAVTITVMK